MPYSCKRTPGLLVEQIPHFAKCPATPFSPFLSNFNFQSNSTASEKCIFKFFCRSPTAAVEVTSRLLSVSCFLNKENKESMCNVENKVEKSPESNSCMK